MRSRGRCQRGIARSDTLLLCLVVLALLLAAEFVLRAFVVHSALLDPRTDSYWEQVLRERAPSFWASVRNEGDTVHDVELGWRMRPNYESPLATHDPTGYRRTSRPNGSAEGTIVVLGDSFTYGLGVGDHETYASHLAQQTGYEVVNMGVNAYGADQALLLWEKVGVSTGADIVVLGYFVDDFYRNALTVRDGPKPFFRHDVTEGSFVLEGVPVPDLEEYVATLGRQSRLAAVDLASYGIGRIWSRLHKPDPRGVYEITELNKYILKRLRDSVEVSGARLVVLIIGHCYDGSPEYIFAEAAIEEHCEVIGVECMNVARLMRGGDYTGYYGQNCHWSPLGHETVAQHLLPLLLDAQKYNPN